jgi:hypothetical protein
VLDEILKQVEQQPDSMEQFKQGRNIDFNLITDNLKSSSNIPSQKVKRHWDNARKRLKEYSRRESEYLLQARSKLNCDFNTGILNQFPTRLNAYNQEISKRFPKSDTESKHGLARSFKAIETDTEALGNSFCDFLFDPNPQQADSVGLETLEE